MSRQFYLALATAFAGFGCFELYLNLSLRSLNDDVLERCLKPDVLPEVRQEFYFAAGAPISRTVMVNGL
jgi:hypothetical protein